MSAPSPDLLARVTWSLIAEPLDEVALALRRHCGPVDALDLARTGTARELLRRTGTEPRPGAERAATEALSRWRHRLSSLDVGAVLADAGRRRLRVLTPEAPDWPGQRLADLAHEQPSCLWLRGDGDLGELLGRPVAAIVGSRASTRYGEDVATSFAAGLAARGAAVLSGGAYGIDAAAHRGALHATGGATAAVLAGGLDRLYPRGNSDLLERIAARHVLISEAPPGTAPTRWRFLARNRLIAALADATVVVEASWRSGALSTARRADSLRRVVAAVPGPVTSAASAGCHRLLRESDAVLVTEVQDVLELLPGGDPAGEGGFAVQDALDLLEPVDRRVLDAVPPRSSLDLAGIVREVALPEPQVAGAIARLELLGHVEHAGDRIRRPRPERRE